MQAAWVRAYDGWRLTVEHRTDSRWVHTFKRKYSVKERIFLYYMLFFASLAVLTIITNILFGLDFSFNYKWLGLAAFCVVMGILALKGIRTSQVHRLGTYAIALVILPLSWLSSSGLVSPSIIYSLVIMLLINFLLEGTERLIMNGLFLVLHMGLITLYRYQPELFKPMTAQEQFIDWMINVPIIFAFIALLLIVFERAYERERVQGLDKTRRLEVLSNTDPLTGLANRLNLMDDIETRLQDAKQHGTRFSLIILDIDFFKRFNDTYGHLQGDICLKQVSGILQDAARQGDRKAYRFGGEEFLILLPGTDLAGAKVFAQQVREIIRDAAIPNEHSEVSSIITVSMGIASSSPGIDGVTLLRQADTALYSAKSAGRDGIVCFDPET